MKYFTDEMPLRYRDHKPTEQLAKEEIEKRDKGSVSGVGRYDNQPWTPPVKTPIVYPKNQNRQTRIPLEFDWSTIDLVAHDEPGWWSYTDRRCHPVCRHTGPCQNLDGDDRDQDLDGHNDRDYVDPDAEWDWVPEGREELPELPDAWYDVPEIPRGFVTGFDHRKRLKEDYRTDEQGRWYHKRAQPYRTWDTSSRKVRDENDWMLAEDDGNVWREDSTPGKSRGPLYDGKRAAAGEGNTMPAGSWGVFQQWKWSQAQLICSVCRADLPEGRRRYCSAGCAVDGDNANDRQKRNKERPADKRTWKFPSDKYGWYIQRPSDPERWDLTRYIEYRRERPANGPWLYAPAPKVHRYEDHEATVPHTVSKDYRLSLPVRVGAPYKSVWPEEPKVWRIEMTTCKRGHQIKTSQDRDRWGACIKCRQAQAVAA